MQKTPDSPQLQSIAGRHLPLRFANADPYGPVCSADHGDSTVAAFSGGRCPCCVGSCKSSGAAVEKTLALPQLQLVEKSPPVVSNHMCSVVQTAENCGVSAVAVHDSRRHPFRAANADPHGPDYSADHRVSTVAVLSWWSMFLLAVVHILRCCLCEDSRDPTVAARARIANMGYDCAFALRGSGARVSVCGYADMGKCCALALLGLVLVFISVVAQRQLPWSAYSADHRDCPVADH